MPDDHDGDRVVQEAKERRQKEEEARAPSDLRISH
jgi:hypothetical protein